MTAAVIKPAHVDGHLPDDWATREWTVDQLATLPKDLRYELIDGRLVLPSPTMFHQEIQNLVWMALRANRPSHLTVSTDTSLEINQKNEPRPDVVIARKALGFRTPVPVVDSLLAVEVVSPTSGSRDTIAKRKIYADAGIEDYLIIDPDAEPDVELWHFHLDDSGRYELVGKTSGEFTTDRPYPITIDLPELTATRKDFRDHREF